MLLFQINVVNIQLDHSVQMGYLVRSFCVHNSHFDVVELNKITLKSTQLNLLFFLFLQKKNFDKIKSSSWEYYLTRQMSNVDWSEHASQPTTYYIQILYSLDFNRANHFDKIPQSNQINREICSGLFLNKVLFLNFVFLKQFSVNWMKWKSNNGHSLVHTNRPIA